MMRLKTKRGFTLIETMVAISLLAISLTGPYVAVQNAVQSSYVARDQLVASQLAQEGIEYIRSIRDNNYLASPQRTWLDGFTGAGASARDACYNPTGVTSYYCTVDPTQGDFHSPPNLGMLEHSSTTTAPFLYISSNGLYNQQNNGTPSKFKRLVRIYSIDNGPTTEIQVTVQVLWTTGPRSYSIMVVDNLRDWI